MPQRIPPARTTSRGPKRSTRYPEGHQPGFERDEYGKRHLDRSSSPMELGVDRIYEQRPAVLQIRDHGHADDADRQLHPPIRRRLRAQPFLDYRTHILPLAARSPRVQAPDATAVRIVATL